MLMFWLLSFHGNGFTILCIFYFVAYFHHDTKSRTGNEIGQKFNFLWFPQKLTVFRKSGNFFQVFWSTELPSVYGLKITTWSLNTLYLHFFSLSTQYSLGIANLRKIFQSMDLPFLAKNAKTNVQKMVNHIIGAWLPEI